MTAIAWNWKGLGQIFWRKTGCVGGNTSIINKGGYTINKRKSDHKGQVDFQEHTLLDHGD